MTLALALLFFGTLRWLFPPFMLLFGLLYFIILLVCLRHGSYGFDCKHGTLVGKQGSAACSHTASDTTKSSTSRSVCFLLARQHGSPRKQVDLLRLLPLAVTTFSFNDLNSAIFGERFGDQAYLKSEGRFSIWSFASAEMGHLLVDSIGWELALPWDTFFSNCNLRVRRR